MADVTLRHPVTGAEKTVSHQKAVTMKEAGWQDTRPLTRRSVGGPDKTDVEAGRAALAAGNGSIPAEPVKKNADTKGTAAAKKAEIKQDDKSPEQKEAEAGHAGLQVDTGATNA